MDVNNIDNIIENNDINNLKFLNDINDESYINNNIILPNVVNFYFENKYLSNLNLNNLDYNEYNRIKNAKYINGTVYVGEYTNLDRLISQNDYNYAINLDLFDGCIPNKINNLLSKITRRLDLYNFEYTVYSQKIIDYNYIFKQRIFPYTNDKININYNKFITKQNNRNLFNTYFQYPSQTISIDKTQINNIYIPIDYYNNIPFISIYYDNELIRFGQLIAPSSFNTFNGLFIECIDVDNLNKSAKIKIGFRSAWIRNLKTYAYIIYDLIDNGNILFNNLNEINIGNLNSIIPNKEVSSVEYLKIGDNSFNYNDNSFNYNDNSFNYNDNSFNYNDNSFNYDDNSLNDYTLKRIDNIKVIYKSIKYNFINQLDISNIENNNDIIINIYNGYNEKVDSFGNDYYNIKMIDNVYTLTDISFDFKLDFDSRIVIEIPQGNDIVLTNYYDNSYVFQNEKTLYTYYHDSFILDIINNGDKYINDEIYKNLYSYEYSLPEILDNNNIQLSNRNHNKIQITKLDDYEQAEVDSSININELTKKCLPTIIESSDISNIGYYWYPLFINAIDINSSYIIRNSHMLSGIMGNYYHSKLINLDINSSFLDDIKKQIDDTDICYDNIDLNIKKLSSPRKLHYYDFYKIDLEKGLIIINTEFGTQRYLPLLYKINERHEKWLEIINNNKLIVRKYNYQDISYSYKNASELYHIGDIVINYYNNKIYLFTDPDPDILPDIIENINFEQHMKDVVLHNDSGILSLNFNNEELLRILYNGLYGKYWNIYTNIIPKHYNNIDLNLIKDYQIDIKSNNIYGNEIINYYKLSEFNNINIINSSTDNFDNFSDNYDFKLYFSDKILIDDNSANSFNDFSNNNLEIILKNNGKDYQIKTHNFNNEKSLFYNIDDLINNFNNRIKIINENIKSNNYLLHETNSYIITKEDVIIYTETDGSMNKLPPAFFPYHNIIIKNNGTTITDFKNVLKNGFNFYDINKEITFFDNTSDLTIEGIKQNFSNDIDIDNGTEIAILDNHRVLTAGIINTINTTSNIELLPSYDISINNILYSNNNRKLIKDYFTYHKSFEKIGNLIVKKQKIRLIDGSFNIFRKNNFKIQTYNKIDLYDKNIILNSSYLKEEDITNYSNINNIGIDDKININIIYNNQYMDLWFVNHIFLDGEFNNGSYLSNPIIVKKKDLSFNSFKVIDQSHNRVSEQTILNTKHLIEITYNQNKYYIKNIRNETLNIDDFILSDKNYDINTQINVRYNSLEGPLELSFSNKKHTNYIQNYIFNKHKMEKIFSHENTVMPPIHFSFIN